MPVQAVGEEALGVFAARINLVGWVRVRTLRTVRLDPRIIRCKSLGRDGRFDKTPCSCNLKRKRCLRSWADKKL
jgi:hypothetical protein